MSHFLDESNCPADPMELFNLWWSESKKDDTQDQTVMTLATISEEGTPSARIVLLKSADHNGFLFFTNYTSRKAIELEKNPATALVIHWEKTKKQVRVEGNVKKISDLESDEYFQSRPYGSQIGAWASPQSRIVPTRDYLLIRFKKYKDEFIERKVNRPANWGGYRVIPEKIEFWMEQENRLHDRILYTKDNNQWGIARLAP